MPDAVVMRPENTVVFLRPLDGPSPWRVDPETSPEGWEIRPDVEVNAPANLSAWPIGTDRPEAVLCVSKENEKVFQVFKYRREIDGSRFRETGWSYGGVWAASAPFWEKLLGHHAEMQARWAEPDDDPPIMVDEALDHLRSGR